MEKRAHALHGATYEWKSYEGADVDAGTGTSTGINADTGTGTGISTGIKIFGFC